MYLYTIDMKRSSSPSSGFLSLDCLVCSAEGSPSSWTLSSSTISSTGSQMCKIITCTTGSPFILKFLKYAKNQLFSLCQRWGNVPPHPQLHENRPPNPPRELHPGRAPAGGGQVLRASRSVWILTNITMFIGANSPQNLCHI